MCIRDRCETVGAAGQRAEEGEAGKKTPPRNNILYICKKVIVQVSSEKDVEERTHAQHVPNLATRPVESSRAEARSGPHARRVSDLTLPVLLP